MDISDPPSELTEVFFGDGTLARSWHTSGGEGLVVRLLEGPRGHAGIREARRADARQGHFLPSLLLWKVSVLLYLHLKDGFVLF